MIDFICIRISHLSGRSPNRCDSLPFLSYGAYNLTTITHHGMFSFFFILIQLNELIKKATFKIIGKKIL